MSEIKKPHPKKTQADYFDGQELVRCKICQDNYFVPVDEERNIWGHCSCHPSVVSGTNQKASVLYENPF